MNLVARLNHVSDSPARASEPPDLFWWCRVHASLRVTRQIGAQGEASIVRFSGQPGVDSIFHPETTNIKLVARWERRLRSMSGRYESSPASDFSAFSLTRSGACRCGLVAGDPAVVNIPSFRIAVRFDDEIDKATAG